MPTVKMTKAGTRRLMRIARDLEQPLQRHAPDLWMPWWGHINPDKVNKAGVVPITCTTNACLAGHVTLNEGMRFVVNQNHLESAKRWGASIVEITECKAPGKPTEPIPEVARRLLFGKRAGTQQAQLACSDLFGGFHESSRGVWRGLDHRNRAEAGKAVRRFVKKYGTA